MKYRGFVASSDIPVALAGRGPCKPLQAGALRLPFFIPISFCESIHNGTGYKKTVAFATAFLACGEGGIRTPGAFQLNSFQDCRNRPLYHLSNPVWDCKCKQYF